MTGYDLVIFDCDGVLVDSELLSCGCAAETLAGYGLPIGVEEVFDRFLGRSVTAIADHFRAVKGTPLPDAFYADYRSRLTEAFARSLRSMPHVRDVLARLDSPYCLASSSDAARIRLTLSVAGLETYFGDRIYNAEMVRHGKPAPDLFLLAAKRMGARPERTIVVEDTVPGVTAGKAAGMTVWGFTGGSHCTGRPVDRHLAEAGADRVFASMADFLPH